MSEVRHRTSTLQAITDLKNSGFKNTQLILNQHNFADMFYDNVTKNISNYHKVIDELLLKLDLHNDIIRKSHLSQNNSFNKDNFHTHI